MDLRDQGEQRCVVCAQAPCACPSKPYSERFRPPTAGREMERVSPTIQARVLRVEALLGRLDFELRVAMFDALARALALDVDGDTLAELA